MLDRFNMQNCKPSFTPMKANVDLSIDTSPQTSKEMKFMANIPYQRAVGCLTTSFIGPTKNFCGYV